MREYGTSAATADPVADQLFEVLLVDLGDEADVGLLAGPPHPVYHTLPSSQLPASLYRHVHIARFHGNLIQRGSVQGQH